MAGLGNIYVDEVLYRAKVHPARLGQSLTAREAKVIRKETIAVLAQAVEKGGSTIRSYSNAFGEDGTMQEEHQVYGKQASLVCTGTPIEKIQLGDAEPILPALSKGELDGKNHRINRRDCFRKVHCDLLSGEKKGILSLMLIKWFMVCRHQEEPSTVS